MAARKTSSNKTALAAKKAARPATVAEYLASLPADKRAVAVAAQKFVRANIPDGYSEFMNWGVINWGIPLSEFSNTYNGHPLFYVALGSHKSYFSLYLTGAYGDPKQTAFLKDEFKKAGKRFDMGKSCLHFQTLDDLELKSVAKVIGMLGPKQFIDQYKKLKGL